MINGSWGSGKTFLCENYLVDAISDIEVGKNERKSNIYISLYGVSSIEALSKQLLTSYFQEENHAPRSFSNEEDKQKYIELYNPIAKSRKRRNEMLDKGEIEEENIYINADSFLKHCQMREEYYCSHRAFMEYINEDKLINSSSLEYIYTIVKAFNTIYYMGNVKEFYLNDIDALQCLKSDLCNKERINTIGITRKCALEYLASVIEKVLVGLGAEDGTEE